MSWRDGLARVTMPDGRRLIGGSFRGVPFFVEEASRGGGRRVQVHEFPLRDQPYVEDLGRASRVFQFSAYVLGDEYTRARDALLAALEDTAGPGELVHPYYGRIRGICTGLSVRESVRDGGMATFSIEITEADDAVVVPVEQPDLPALVEVAADEALVAVEEELVSSYDVDGQPSFALASLEEEFELRVEGLRDALLPVVQTTQELARLDVEFQGLVSNAASEIRAPATVLDSLLSVLGNLADTIEAAPREVLQALLETYALTPVASAVGTSATRQRERDNQVALTAAVRRMLAIEAARLLPRVEYSTIEEARADVDAVVELMDEQLLDAGDAAYPALMALRAAVTRAVPGSAVLARVVTVERTVAVPSLLLSYQLYGTVEQEADIVARNRARHPGFLSGALQVLSNV